MNVASESSPSYVRHRDAKIPIGHVASDRAWSERAQPGKHGGRAEARPETRQTSSPQTLGLPRP
jgi:hypothetical protein